MSNYKYIYGPINSKRLGRSLGVDIIPFKICNYDCIYCQLGNTKNKTNQRKEYVKIADVLNELKTRLTECNPDYISIVGSGEPTLNSKIGSLIKEIKKISDIPVCVITNGSLLHLPEVQNDLLNADLVIPSLDIGDAKMFEEVNRPHNAIDFDKMVVGIAEFTKKFKGQVWLEVLLLNEITDTDESIENISRIIDIIKPDKVQINTISRPTANNDLLPSSINRLNEIKNKFNGVVDVVCSSETSEDKNSSKDITKDDVLEILSRHQSSKKDLAKGLEADTSKLQQLLNELINEDKIYLEKKFGKEFYVLKKE